MNVFEELEGGVVLRDRIHEILREGPRSISQVVKGLAAEGIKLHRLAVAGYLKALADEGVLDEAEIPPAKVYRLRAGAATRDLHRQVGERVRAGSEGLDASRLALEVFTQLFRRPVFAAEFRRGDLELPVRAVDVEGEERAAARRHLSKAGLKLPNQDAAFKPAYADPGEAARYRAQAHALLADMVRDEFHAGALAVTTMQAKLGDLG